MKLIVGPEEGWVPPSSRQRSIGIMMYLRYSGFRQGEVNGLTPEDLASRTLYRRCPVGFVVYHGLQYLINSSVIQTFILYVFY